MGMSPEEVELNREQLLAANEAVEAFCEQLGVGDRGGPAMCELVARILIEGRAALPECSDATDSIFTEIFDGISARAQAAAARGRASPILQLAASADAVKHDILQCAVIHADEVRRRASGTPGSAVCVGLAAKDDTDGDTDYRAAVLRVAVIAYEIIAALDLREGSK